MSQNTQQRKNIYLFIKNIDKKIYTRHSIKILIILLGIILGIYTQKNYPFNLITLIITTIITSISLLIFITLKKLTNITSIISILIISFIVGLFALHIQQNKALSIYNTLKNKNLDIKGVISKKDNNPNQKIKEILNLKIKSIKESNSSTYKNSNINILFYLYQTSNLEIDDEIELKNIHINTPKHKKNSLNNKNFQDYLIKENIAGSIFSKRIVYQKLTRPKNSTKRWFQQKRETVLSTLKNKLTPQAFSLFSCMFLGNKKQTLLKRKKNLFNYWGISHFLARSGIHVVLLIIVWKFFLNFLPFPFLTKHIFLLLLFIFYILLSWSSISFLRAVTIFLAYTIAKLINRQTSLIHILTITCISILILNPMQLFFLDFQLSFSLTFALTYFMKIFI
jgi:competence protein ComEC